VCGMSTVQNMHACMHICMHIFAANSIWSYHSPELVHALDVRLNQLVQLDQIMALHKRHTDIISTDWVQQQGPTAASK